MTVVVTLGKNPPAKFEITVDVDRNGGGWIRVARVNHSGSERTGAGPAEGTTGALTTTSPPSVTTGLSRYHHSARPSDRPQERLTAPPPAPKPERKDGDG